MAEGFTHLYYGYGKGKTTAACGLAARALGHGMRVLFAQFLKNPSSGEIASLKALGADTLAQETPVKFVWQMDAAEKESLFLAQRDIFRRCAEALASGQYDLIVLDEATDAADEGIITEAELLSLIDARSRCEIVLTGHKAPSAVLLDRCCYITEMRAVKHPFTDRKTPARRGIEF